MQAIEKDGDADGEIPKDQKALKLSTYVISDESGGMVGLTNGVHRPYGYSEALQYIRTDNLSLCVLLLRINIWFLKVIGI